MNESYGICSFYRKVSAVVESIDVQNYVPSKESGKCNRDKKAPDLCELWSLAVKCIELGCKDMWYRNVCRIRSRSPEFYFSSETGKKFIHVNGSVYTHTHAGLPEGRQIFEAPTCRSGGSDRASWSNRGNKARRLSSSSITNMVRIRVMFGVMDCQGRNRVRHNHTRSHFHGWVAVTKL